MIHIHLPVNITLIKNGITIYWFHSDYSNFSYKSAHVGVGSNERKKAIAIRTALLVHQSNSCGRGGIADVLFILALRVQYIRYKRSYSLFTTLHGSIRLIEWLSATGLGQIELFVIRNVFKQSLCIYLLSKRIGTLLKLPRQIKSNLK